MQSQDEGEAIGQIQRSRDTGEIRWKACLNGYSCGHHRNLDFQAVEPGILQSLQGECWN